MWLEPRVHELAEEFSNAARDYSVGLCFVLPIPHTSIAVTQKEIAIQVSADNACLLLGPPRRLERSPVGFTNEARDYEIAISKRKGERRPEAADGLLDGV
jgi:hypothetical protein